MADSNEISPIFTHQSGLADIHDSAYHIEMRTFKMTVAVLLTSAITLIIGSSLFLTISLPWGYQKNIENTVSDLLVDIMWFHYIFLVSIAVLLILVSLIIQFKMRARADEIDSNEIERLKTLRTPTEATLGAHIESVEKYLPPVDEKHGQQNRD